MIRPTTFLGARDGRARGPSHRHKARAALAAHQIAIGDDRQNRPKNFLLHDRRSLVRPSQQRRRDVFLRFVALATGCDGGAMFGRVVDQAGDALELALIDHPAVIRA